jgi:glycosyltransferase involved in cell wall biosynthesis
MIVTVSDVLRKSLIDSGVPATKVITIPNGVDESFFSDVNLSPTEIYRGKIVIGFVGSLKPWHGIDFLVESYRILAEDPVYHLLIVGDGSKMKLLRKFEQELPGRVTLTGNVPHEEVLKYVDVMDIAVAPYPAFEDFYFSPLKVLEYMARGKAIVATEQGQIKDLIRHNETGWLVPPGNQAQFVDAIKELAQNSLLRKKLGESAAAEARISHSWKQRVSHILECMPQN